MRRTYSRISCTVKSKSKNSGPLANETRTGEPTRRSSGLRKVVRASCPLPLPLTRSMSISQRVLPVFFGSAISASQNGRDNPRDDMAEAQNETAYHDCHGDVAF